VLHPVLPYDVPLGDFVETGVEYRLSSVVKPSGQFVFRVWFGESFHPRLEIADELVALGALVEWSSANLLAVDAADVEQAQRLSDCMLGHEQAGHLVYETGRSA
jgi:Domain of unknown function (DUF4265)